MNKPKTALSGAGFYIVLLLCIMIVGVSGYMILFGDHAGTQDPAQPNAAVSTPAVDVYEGLDPEGPSQEVIETERLPHIPQAQAEAPVKMPSVEVDDTPVMAKAPTLVVWPLRGEVVAAFSVETLSYDETMGDWRTHAGVDLAAAIGTQVMAASAGTVSSVTDDALMGTTVVIKHSGGYQTNYSNLNATPTVKVGDSVTAGQVIGAVGDTAIAEAAQPPHLHFSVEKDGDAINPETYLKD